MHPRPTPVCPELVVPEGTEGQRPSFTSDNALGFKRKAVLRQAQDKRVSVSNGFSLVELMVVIFIIGLLATVVLINVLPSQEKAMRVKAQGDIATLAQAMEMYRLDNLTYPGAADGLASLRTPPANLALPQNYRSGGYIKDLPSDPWGRPYQFASPGQAGRPFEIFSLGADGKPGGEGNDADIYAEKR